MRRSKAKNAQEAHEAIRPTQAGTAPEQAPPAQGLAAGPAVQPDLEQSTRFPNDCRQDAAGIADPLTLKRKQDFHV